MIIYTEEIKSSPNDMIPFLLVLFNRRPGVQNWIPRGDDARHSYILQHWLRLTWDSTSVFRSLPILSWWPNDEWRETPNPYSLTARRETKRG